MNKRIISGKFNTGKTALTIIILNISQLALIAAVLLYLTDAGKAGGFGLLSNPLFIALLIIIPVAVAINTIAVLRNRAGLLKADTEFGLLRDTLARLEKLNAALRAQRHDFMNHLQVVYSLIEMKEYGEAGDYIEKVYNDIQKLSRVLKTSNPAVNALLQAKMMTCEKNGITVELNVTTQLRDLKIPAWELCRVLGNLLDNAIYALKEKNTGRRLKIQLAEDLKYYCFKVENNGDPIPAALSEKIFQPGFTTKGENGEGMGLYISREILGNYGGCLSFSSETGSTVFEGRIPRQ